MLNIVEDESVVQLLNVCICQLVHRSLGYMSQVVFLNNGVDYASCLKGVLLPNSC